MGELHDHNKPILISPDIKNKPLLADGIDRGKVSLDIHSVAPLGTLDDCDPVEQSRLTPRLSLIILPNLSRADNPHPVPIFTAKVQTNS